MKTKRAQIKKEACSLPVANLMPFLSSHLSCQGTLEKENLKSIQYPQRLNNLLGHNNKNSQCQDNATWINFQVDEE